MATSRCLVCDEDIPDSNNGNGVKHQKTSPSSSGNSSIPVFNEAKLKFILTPTQYTSLQKVLSLPEGVCKNELSFGPYCRNCFTEINNVCHCLSALETLQKSIVEFRNGFGTKIQKSCETGGTTEKRKRKPVDESVHSARFMILSCLKNTVFKSGIPIADIDAAPFSQQIMHETFTHMDPNSGSTAKIEKDQVVCTTNGNMPKNRGMSKVQLKKKTKTTSAKKKVEVKTKSSSRNLKPKSPKLETETAEPSASGKVHSCWCCTSKFSSEAALSLHEETVHRIPCPNCPRIFHTTKSLEAHRLKAHSIGLSSASASAAALAGSASTSTTPISKKKKKGKSKSRSPRKLPKCNLCPKQFGNYKALTTHQEKVHGVKPQQAENGNTGEKEAQDGSEFRSIFVLKPKALPPSSKPKLKTRPGRCQICTKIVLDIQAHMKNQHPKGKEPEDPPSSSTIDEKSLPIARPKTTPEKEEVQKTGLLPNPVVLNPNVQETKTDKNSDISNKDENSSNSITAEKVDDGSSKTEVSPVDSSPPKSKPALSFTIPMSLIPLAKPSGNNQGQGSGNSTSSSGSNSKYQFKNLLK